MNEDDSQSDSHPEASVSQRQTTRNSDPENPHDIATGVHEEVTYCSTGTSAGVQMHLRYVGQSQICSETTPATIEVEQFYWPVSKQQQLWK